MQICPALVREALADTVTIDGHKQLFMPMGCGMLVIRTPAVQPHCQDSQLHYPQGFFWHGSVHIGGFAASQCN